MSYQGISSHLSTLQTDPIRNFKYLVNITHTVADPKTGYQTNIGFNLGFTSVSGLSASTAQIPYRSGGLNTTVQQIPGQTSFSPVTFMRGMLLGQHKGWRWFQQLFSVTTAEGSPYIDNSGHYFRGQVDIYVLPHPQATNTFDVTGYNAHITLYNAWPQTVSYSDLNAGDNGFLVEQMVLVHEGFDIDEAIRPNH